PTSRRWRCPSPAATRPGCRARSCRTAARPADRRRPTRRARRACHHRRARRRRTPRPDRSPDARTRTRRARARTTSARRDHTLARGDRGGRLRLGQRRAVGVRLGLHLLDRAAGRLDTAIREDLSRLLLLVGIEQRERLAERFAIVGFLALVEL